LNGRQLRLRVLLDEGVPRDVGRTFELHGHDVMPFEESVKRGARDELVCAAAEANDALLVSFDNDMKQAARRHGTSPARFKQLNLLKFTCPEPMAAKRLAEAMSLLEHEWMVAEQSAGRRVYMEISTHVLRTFR
jgi:predicted nuclease of predicted toxin-antitoxin system